VRVLLTYPEGSFLSQGSIPNAVEAMVRNVRPFNERGAIDLLPLHDLLQPELKVNFISAQFKDFCRTEIVELNRSIPRDEA
jgi:hypothetical protein